MVSAEALKKQAQINRQAIVDMIHTANAGHPGGSLSVIDLLTAIYATDVDLTAEKRSKVVLSKGHAVPAQYAILHQYGILSDDEMKTLRRLDSRLQGHPCTHRLPQVDATTGLLGQGLSIGIGMAIAKRDGGDAHNVYVICGDGEVNEGQIWEAAEQAAHFRLNNLICVVDQNRLSSSGFTKEVMDNRDLQAKFAAFGWQAETIDGHDMEQILEALSRARAWKDGPYAIIANTVKGKGVSYMENNVAYHSSGIAGELYDQAVRDLAKEGC
ncbi:MAG: transketolase [Clostridia bacterium]|nr:transketolase [Clostridia bacterium]